MLVLPGKPNGRKITVKGLLCRFLFGILLGVLLFGELLYLLTHWLERMQ